MRKRNLLGVDVCATDYQETCEAVRQAAIDGRGLSLTALAVHGVMTGVLDSAHRERLNALDIIVPDGQPVRWGLNLLYRTGLRDPVCGPDLMLLICRMAAAEGLSIGFYGNRASVLEKLQQTLRRRHPDLRIAIAMPSRFRQVSPLEQKSIAEEIKSSGADILFVGLGCPRQEVWLYEHRDKLCRPMIAVGAAFDFHAQQISHAPQWMRARGMEWFYRLLQEPRRLWRRYLLLNPLYLLLLGAQMCGLRHYDAGQHRTVNYQGFA